ncbi:hypothetical protein AAFF_G00334270 [Aldrovandia affinis]|uniref:Tc1-like transposase DDE domain-containing protein n=1 Tax=Aldrovandia affinis TaxID=143900 RepID=A0AAD7WQF4_9TELE|nr:hypothetical protein AAFF_G00334270 [Aldrovandia affinis]
MAESETVCAAPGLNTLEPECFTAHSGVPKSTVATIIRKWKKFGTTKNLPRPGRPAKLSNRGRRALAREVSRNPRVTLTELQRILVEMGEPFRSFHHLANTIPTVKHGGGSIMMWGCFSAAGTGRLVLIEGKMNAAKYTEILEGNLLQSALDLRLGQRFTFQHDNDPKHTAKRTKEWLRRKSVNVLEWPSQSPDLNPIEHLWKELKMAVYRRSPSNLTELARICQEEWAKISRNKCAKLVASFPRRLEAVIAAKGASTKY